MPNTCVMCGVVLKGKFARQRKFCVSCAHKKRRMDQAANVFSRAQIREELKSLRTEVNELKKAMSLLGFNIGTG